MELLEREHYLTDLADWLGTAAKGGGCIALVGGEAGIGKTSLMQEFARQQRKTKVLWGACDSLFTPRPLAPLHDIARQAQGALLTAVTTSTSRDVIFNAALDELERDAALVVFEDMHWADEATLDLLKFLGRRMQRTKALLVITYRDDEVGAKHPLRFVLGDLPRAHTRRTMLSPLSERAVQQLAKQAGRSTENLHRITGGNPLFVTEVLAESADTVPVTVRDAVLGRASRLSVNAREIAELVSVVPGKTEAWLLEQTVAVDDAGIEGCLGIGMLRDADGALAFRHELTRRAFEDSLSQPRLRTLHAKVFAVLSQRPGVAAARIAHHANGAHNTEAVLHFAPIAAEQAASLRAHREAASHYRIALQYADGLAADERAHLLEQLSYECYLTDQIEDSIDARTSALAIWQSPDAKSKQGAKLKEGDTLRWLSRLSWFAGRRADANRYGADAVAALESLPAGAELAMAYSNRAQLDMLAHEVTSAIAWSQRTLELAEPLGKVEIVSHALNNLGTAKIISGDYSGYADLERSLQLALDGGMQEHVARACTNLSASSVTARHYGHARRYLQQGLAYCEKHDLDSWRLYMLAWSARAKFDLGDWHGAAEDAEAVLQHPRTAPISRAPALILLGHLRIRRGDPDASSALDAARTLVAPTQELQRIAPLAIALAEAAWLADDRAAVIREVQPAYELAQTVSDPWTRGELAAWLRRAGALDTVPTDIAEPYARELSGDWNTAARMWADLGCTYEQANILAHYGGEAEKRQALKIFDELGATVFSQVLRKRMRAEGVRRIPRGSRPSTRNNSLGLTKREAEILALLSDGLRNSAIASRLFLSTKTVDHHVSAILTKLGVPSRAEAVAMARRKP